jgi:uncharacterized protein (DUF1330 family)
MAKGYWVAAYHNLPDEHTRKVLYGPLAEAAVKAGGGRFLTRSGHGREAGREAGVDFAERCTIIEFDDYEQALKLYDSEEFQKAVKVFTDAKVIRDFRIVEGFDL